MAGAQAPSRAVAAVAVALAVLAACGRSGGRDEGPLGEVIGDTRVDECSPARQGDATTIGDIYVTNPTRSDMTFTSVSLLTTDGVALVGASIGDNTLPLVAAGRGYPPVAVTAEVWDRVQPLEGAVVPPDSGEMVILIGLRLDEDRGRAAGVILEYEIDGTSHRVTANRSYSLRPSC